MNLRTFSTVGTVAMLVLGGCVIVDSNGTGGSAGTGNTGNEGGSGNTGNLGGGGSGTAGSGNMGGGGSGGAPACAQKCAEAASEGKPMCADAPMTSMDLYNALADCSCKQMSTATPPGCQDKCTAMAGGTPDLCDGAATPSADCATCVQDTVGGCGVQFGACSNDF